MTLDTCSYSALGITSLVYYFLQELTKLQYDKVNLEDRPILPVAYKLISSLITC